MSKERKSAAISIQKMMKKSGNKLFMGMVHHVYGPLRGLNYILANPNVEEILDLLDEQSKGVGSNVKLKIWEKTGMSVDFLILPFKMTNEAENYPTEVRSLEEGTKEILKTLSTSPAEKDIWFYRVGKF